MSLRAQPVLSPTAVESIPAEQYRTRSRLGRLYLYSKDTAFTAQENFTTEALALAVLESAQPMLRAIRRMSTVAECPFAFKSVVSLRPRTQVYTPGGGFLDLVLDAFDANHFVVGEAWVEVKVGAPESGTQLDAYREEEKRQYPRVWLITRAPRPRRGPQGARPRL